MALSWTFKVAYALATPKKKKKLTALSKNTFMRSMEETGGLLKGRHI